VYFAVGDMDAAAARIEELGGRVAVQATQVPGGRFLVGQDPEGAFFGLFAGKLDD
jgi:predicted enzyme related to lactoylglutathione lyase